MTWSKSGSTVTQSGTDANLGTLSSVSGVSVQNAGDFTFYFLGPNDRLNINGTLTIDPRIEMLVTRWGGNNSTPGIHIGGNGTLTIGRGITSTTSSQDPAPESFGAGTGLVIAADGPQCCDDGSIDVRGTLEMFNSTIKTRGVMEWNNGCTVRIRNGTILNTDPSSASATNNTRIRINEGENIDIIGLTTFNMQLDYLTDEAFENFEGLLAQDIAIGVENGFQTIGAQRVWRAVPDYGATSQAFASNFDCLKDLRVINSARGSDTVLVPDRSNGTHFNNRRNRVTVTTTAQAAGNLTTLNVANSTGIAAGQRLRIGDNNNGFIRVVASVTTGVITLTEDTPSAQPSNTVVSNVTAYGGRIFHELNVSVVDAAGTGIENAKVYIRDTDHGNRIETDSAGDIDETDDRTYEETTNAQGVADTMTVLTGMWYRQDRVGDIAAPNGNEICDVRGKNNTRGEDLFDIQVWSYPHLPFEVRDVRLNGTAAVNQTVALLADALVTETNQTTVSAYTELDTAAKAYDYVKDQIYDNFAGETEMPLSREGTTLTFTTTRNITLAAAGATPFSSDANSITIVTGATFNGNLRSSNSTITVSAGVSVSGFVTDTAGTASTVQVRPASGDYTVTLFAADGTQRGTGTGDQDFALTPTQAEAGMKVVCQRAGYGSEVRTLDTSAGGVFTVSFTALRQHLLPNGSVMLGADLSSEVSVAFVLTDLTDVQSRIDVGDLFVAAPVLYNEFDAALATDDGRKFLAFGGSQITIDIDPVSGNKVYLNASGNKLRRAAAGDNNSGVNSTVYHPDNQPVDDTNGSVQINAGIDTAILARTLFVDVDIDTATAGHNSVLSLLQSADTSITDIVTALVGADWDPNTAGTQTLNDITAAIATRVLSIQGDVESTTHGLAAIRTAVGSGGGGGGGGTALTQTAFDALMLAVPGTTKDSFKATVTTPPTTADIASAVVTAVQAADFSSATGVQTLASLLAGIKTAIDAVPTDSAPSASDIVTAIQAADFGSASGTQNLATVLAAIKTAIDDIPTDDLDLSSVENQLTSTTHGLSAIKTAVDGLPTPATTSEIVTAISNADFGSASGTQTLQTILGNIVTNVTPLPDLEKLLKVCAAILGGKAVYTESTSTVVFRDVEDTIDAVTIVYGSGEGDRNTVTLHPNLQ